MSKKEAFSALDQTLENDFDEIPPIMKPLVIKETKVPATREEDPERVRQELYDVSTKLSSCFEFLVNNFESQMNAPGLLKASPTGDIVELAKALVYVDKQILTAGAGSEKPKEKPSEEYNTQYNTVITDKTGGITTAVLDKMIKDAVSNVQNINNNKGNV